MQTQKNVIIIGGGMAGLTAASYLGQSGAQVTLFEKASTLGGRASTQSHDGFRFNRGIHALYTGGAATEVFHELGIPYSGHSPKEGMALRQGKFHLAPISVSTMMRSDLFGMADKLELMRLLMILATLKACEWGHVSIQQWLDQNVRRPPVKQFLEASARTSVYSAALDLVSVDVFITRMQITAKNPVVYIDDGWQSLVEGLRKKAVQVGVKIVSGARVEAIECEQGRVTGVRLGDGQRVQADAVIIAIPPHEAVKLVPGLKPPVAAQIACLDVALSHLPNTRHTVVQALETPCFMSAQSLYSRVAPEGGAVIYSFKQLDPTRENDPHEDERDLEALLDCAQPGWREVVVKRQFLPRIEAIGALPMVSGGGMAGRPQVRVPGVDGLFLAGDWVGSEGWLVDASLASAREAARLLNG